MTGGAGFGYIDAGCGPDDIVAAVNEGSFDTASMGLGGIGRAGCTEERGGGAAAGPMPGPIAFASCLQKTNFSSAIVRLVQRTERTVRDPWRGEWLQSVRRN
jgi:hypothetical protein